MFLCFEGIDGAGKTLQAVVLAQRLRDSGTPVIEVGDPGTTPVGLACREILLNRDAPLTHGTQLMLFCAARADLTRYIKEQLAQGVTVLCARWLLSTLVYQCELNNFEPQFIWDVFHQTSGLLPDITFLLDLSGEDSVARIGQGADRYERIKVEGREKLRQAYLRQAKNWNTGGHYKTPVVVLPAAQPVDVIHEQIFERYMEHRSQVVG